MKFEKNQPIFQQIADHICDAVLNRVYPADEKIPSVREMAASLQVNPNTVMRAYADLTQKQILYNQRGIGFFVEKNAVQSIREMRRRDFLEKDLPGLFKTMMLLDIEFKELESLYNEFIAHYTS